MRPYYILVFLLLAACTDILAPGINEEPYGDLYFTMDCVWRTHDDGETLWWCSSDVETELISGYLALELLEDGRLAFCGEDLSLNTGLGLHDNLISFLTNNMFNCILAAETELGDEFDWLWYKEDKTLQIIWRPKESANKQLTLIIDPGMPVTNVRGRVYYLEFE